MNTLRIEDVKIGDVLAFNCDYASFKKGTLVKITRIVNNTLIEFDAPRYRSAFIHRFNRPERYLFNEMVDSYYERLPK